ncbi:hypothetical protein ACFPN2_10255 [Steroidobacter flavus]|uniref:Uncharacterized protein n=1 Tax=Steroidobacter flavus TaxID=1842136 RepID=A0ABV8SRA2_9GAMM
MSAVALAVAMVAWFDLFAFSKVVYMPRWAAFLPMPPFAGAVIAIPFLIPIAFFSHSLRAARLGILWTAALAPVPAMVVYALTPLHQHSGLPLNLLVQYSLLALIGCLLPGAVMLGFRMVVGRIKRS